ncbi:hypothetical protein JTB14_030231 [Gonioctena quinquepunctata]|nr:hypothetical protein JTB14_030231 [Gonioctena quinquepunctata]
MKPAEPSDRLPFETIDIERDVPEKLETDLSGIEKPIKELPEKMKKETSEIDSAKRIPEQDEEVVIVKPEPVEEILIEGVVTEKPEILETRIEADTEPVIAKIVEVEETVTKKRKVKKTKPATLKKEKEPEVDKVAVELPEKAEQPDEDVAEQIIIKKKSKTPETGEELSVVLKDTKPNVIEKPVPKSDIEKPKKKIRKVKKPSPEKEAAFKEPEEKFDEPSTGEKEDITVKTPTEKAELKDEGKTEVIDEIVVPVKQDTEKEVVKPPTEEKAEAPTEVKTEVTLRKPRDKPEVEDEGEAEVIVKKCVPVKQDEEEEVLVKLKTKKEKKEEAELSVEKH